LWGKECGKSGKKKSKSAGKGWKRHEREGIARI